MGKRTENNRGARCRQAIAVLGLLLFLFSEGSAGIVFAQAIVIPTDHVDTALKLDPCANVTGDGTVVIHVPAFVQGPELRSTLALTSTLIPTPTLALPPTPVSSPVPLPVGFLWCCLLIPILLLGLLAWLWRRRKQRTTVEPASRPTIRPVTRPDSRQAPAPLAWPERKSDHHPRGADVTHGRDGRPEGE